MINLILIKQKLLDSDCFKDNDYLIFYLKLIENNIKTERQKFKTNKHHIIPKCYFKLKNLEIDNSNDNLVNLLYKDHILAHYYLCLCCTNDKLRYYLESSLQYMLDTYIIEREFIENIKQLDAYQSLYEHRRRYLSDIQKGQPSCTLGRVAINKEGRQKFVKSEMLNDFLLDGWKIGALSYSKPRINPMLGKHHSKETKDKISKSRIGKDPWNKGKKGSQKWSLEQKEKQSRKIAQLKTIHLDDNIEKRVPKEQLKTWLNLGWKLGRCKSSISNTSKNHAHSIYCFETNKYYNSMREFYQELNITRDSRLLKKHLNREVDTYKGYHLK